MNPFSDVLSDGKTDGVEKRVGVVDEWNSQLSCTHGHTYRLCGHKERMEKTGKEHRIEYV